MGTFLWLSDFHLDPYYGTSNAASTSWNSICTKNSTIDLYPFGHVGCDAPSKLVKDMLQHIAASKGTEIDFVLVTGDFSRHATDHLDNGIAETTAIISTISEALKHAFPSIPIVPSIGNNDVFPDYFVDLEIPGTENPILNISKEGFKTLFESEESLQAFSQGGYHARNVTDSLTILSLNTVIYSLNHFPDQTYLDDPMGQLSWLEAQLNFASRTGRSVYILGHIPPTIGSFRHSQFWHDKYMDRYFSILQNYLDTVVKGHLFGHLHSDEFRLLQPFSSSSAVPLYIASSVTPVYGSNPSYRLVHYDPRTSNLLDYQTFYLNLEKIDGNVATGGDVWVAELPGFAATYDLNDMSSTSLRLLLDRLAEPWEMSNDIWEAFLDRQYVSTTVGASCDGHCRAEWLCTLQAISKDDYASCASKSYTFGLRLLVAAAVILSVLLAGCLTIGCRRYLKRRHFLKIDQVDKQNSQSSMPGDIETCDCNKSQELEVRNSTKGEMA
jgi:sphingomyelin phosphodiesterase acid-like 3